MFLDENFYNFEKMSHWNNEKMNIELYNNQSLIKTNDRKWNIKISS